MLENRRSSQRWVLLRRGLPGELEPESARPGNHMVAADSIAAAAQGDNRVGAPVHNRVVVQVEGLGSMAVEDYSQQLTPVSNHDLL